MWENNDRNYYMQCSINNMGQIGNDSFSEEITKYASDTTSQETVDALISIRDFLRESMSDNNINFDMYC
jgi:hypothetical protein